MNKRYLLRDISVISKPITAENKRNVSNHPAVDLGTCTPSQLLSYVKIERSGPICIIGNSARGISIANTIIRRSEKPFLLLGPSADKQSAFSMLNPDWILETAQEHLPVGNGAILFSKPYSSYLELCEYFEEWSNKYFIILHLSGGVQVGSEILNLLNAVQQCLIFCDSIPQALRSNEARTITPKEFMSQMGCLLIYSAGVVTKDLIEILPTYQYEKVSNAMNVSSYAGKSIFNPFRAQRSYGASISQTRTMEYKKSLFEMDELQRIFEDGTALLYVARTNSVFLVQIR